MLNPISKLSLENKSLLYKVSLYLYGHPYNTINPYKTMLVDKNIKTYTCTHIKHKDSHRDKHTHTLTQIHRRTYNVQSNSYIDHIRKERYTYIHDIYSYTHICIHTNTYIFNQTAYFRHRLLLPTFSKFT